MSEGSILAFLSYAWTILHEKKKTPSLSAIPSLKFDAILASANKLQVLHVIWVTRSSKSRPRGYKTWVQAQTQNKAQWLAACGHVSANSQSLRFISSLRMNSSFITSRPGQYSIPSSILRWLTRPLTMPFEFFARILSGISTARCLISFKKLTHWKLWNLRRILERKRLVLSNRIAL